ncbi:uncharacterized protein LOC123554721 isoform X2 [Mercenaria mercenaria]|uniref:uncharacterized protein LOC123554721 isoform X2 n=1 Tax=Mercenaria mercenaria TaxID=6596 RepID=UPI001E1E065D|nr:uncharacterized protein LOC123554721 isoform X2 [Mercenaria mercenaria]
MLLPCLFLKQQDLRTFLLVVLILITAGVHFVLTNNPPPSTYIKFQCNNHKKHSIPCAKYDLMHFKDGGVLNVVLNCVTVEKKACANNRKRGYFKHHLYVHYAHIILNDDRCQVILEDSKPQREMTSETAPMILLKLINSQGAKNAKCP